MTAALATIRTAHGMFQVELADPAELVRRIAGTLAAGKKMLLKRSSPEVVDAVLGEVAAQALQAGIGAALYEAGELQRQRAELLEERRRLEEMRSFETAVDAARERLAELIPAGKLPAEECRVLSPDERAKIYDEIRRVVGCIPGWPDGVVVRLGNGRAKTVLEPAGVSCHAGLRLVNWASCLVWVGNLELVAGASCRSWPAGTVLGELRNRLLRVPLNEISLPTDLFTVLLAGQLENDRWHLRRFGPDVVAWVGPSDREVAISREWFEKLLAYGGIEALVQAGLLGEREAGIISSWVEQTQTNKAGGSFDAKDGLTKLSVLLSRVVKGPSWSGTAGQLFELDREGTFKSAKSLGKALAKAAREGLPGWRFGRTRDQVTGTRLWTIARETPKTLPTVVNPLAG